MSESLGKTKREKNYTCKKKKKKQVNVRSAAVTSGRHRHFTYPSVVMVTMVYQKAAGMLVNLLALEPFSA